MIKVKKEKVNCCNVCLSTGNDVLTIVFTYKENPGGMAVMLCRKCRKKLLNVLNKVDFEEWVNNEYKRLPEPKKLTNHEKIKKYVG